MIRSRPIALVLLGLSAACGESAVGPRMQVSDDAASFGKAPPPAPPAATTDTSRFTITIDPRGGTYSLGAGHTVVFPANSVCDMQHTTYGIGNWDRTCAPATAPVVETVSTWIDAKGHPQTDFSPDLRFVPSDDPANWVVLTFADGGASRDPKLNILYCPSQHGRCLDESKHDKTLVTRHDPATGQVSRRIKHFSGYMVGAGDDSTSSLNNLGASANVRNWFVADPNAAPPTVDSPSADNARSGYILVSGRERQ
jgi:hypothetical protein